MMALTLAVALILITLAAGLPAVTADLRRQKEEELIHRGAQYTRAIRQYYRRFGSYPATLEQLEDTSHMRFLRKHYQDPLTNADFRVLHVGEVLLAPKVSKLTVQDGGSASSNSQKGGLVVPDAGQSSSLPDGQVFGGGPIMGVVSTSDKESFRIFNDEDHYNGWLFVYSPLLDTGGLFNRPYDGIPTAGNQSIPLAPPTPLPGTEAPAPGVPLPQPSGGSHP